MLWSDIDYHGIWILMRTQFQNRTFSVYANYIGPSVMTDANQVGPVKGLPIYDDKITENDQCVMKIISIHCILGLSSELG